MDMAHGHCAGPYGPIGGPACFFPDIESVTPLTRSSTVTDPGPGSQEKIWKLKFPFFWGKVYFLRTTVLYAPAAADGPVNIIY